MEFQQNQNRINSNGNNSAQNGSNRPKSFVYGIPWFQISMNQFGSTWICWNGARMWRMVRECIVLDSNGCKMAQNMINSTQICCAWNPNVSINPKWLWNVSSWSSWCRTAPNRFEIRWIGSDSAKWTGIWKLDWNLVALDRYGWGCWLYGPTQIFNGYA